jgi:SNF2 family DNA or RNA helicase
MRVTLELKSKVPTALVVYGDRKELVGIRGVYLDPYKKSEAKGVMPLTPSSLGVLKEQGYNPTLSLDVIKWYNAEIGKRVLLASVYHSPASMDDRLYDFQKRSVAFMEKVEAHGGRMLLADDPRLGKTIQSLVTMNDLVVGEQSIHIFTLKSLRHHWAENVRKWTTFEPIIIEGNKGRRAAELSDHRKERVAFVTNWETLRLLPTGLGKHIKYLIGDECHVVRQRKSEVTKAFMRLRPKYAILASATMVERGPQDYFTYLRVLRPQEFQSYWRFVGWYCETVFNGFGNDIVGSKNSDLLHDHLAPFSLRRKASEVADMPQKIFETIEVEPSVQQMEAYDAIAEEIFVDIGDVQLTIPNALARMVRLKQVSTAPRVLGFDFDSPKVDAIVEYIDSLPKDFQVVVYTSFRENAMELGRRMENVQVFIGGMGSSDSFKNGISRTLVTTPQIGGVGQDYSNAKVIIYADLPLSATLLRQSIERTTKIGVTEPRLIITFACTPIDFAAAETLRLKQEAIEDVDLYEAILRYHKK